MLNSRRKIFLSLILLVLVLTFDQATKNWVSSLENPQQYGMILIKPVSNNGIILGKLATLPQGIKTTILSTIGIMVFCFYLIAMFLIPMQSKYLPLGLGALVGGILGNVTDRFMNGMVIDFISFEVSNRMGPFFNFADAIQWISYAMILFGIRQDMKLFWPNYDLREKFFINPQLQLRFSALISLIVFVVGLIFMIFSFTFFTDGTGSVISHYYFLSALSLLLFLSSLGFVSSLYFSHRFAGPLFAIGKYLKESLSEKKPPLKLRTFDEFKELEKVCTEINQKIHEKVLKQGACSQGRTSHQKAPELP